MAGGGPVGDRTLAIGCIRVSSGERAEKAGRRRKESANSKGSVCVDSMKKGQKTKSFFLFSCR